MAEPERTDAVDQDGLADARPADVGREQPRRVEAVRHRHLLGEDRDVGREAVGDPEDRRAREQVEVLGPAAEEVRRAGRVEAVSVVLQALAGVVGEAVAAEVAGAAGDVGGRHDPVAGAEQDTLAIEYLAAGLGHHAHVLVAADQRESDLDLVRRPGVLLRLTAVGVLVGAADA